MKLLQVICVREILLSDLSPPPPHCMDNLSELFHLLRITSRKYKSLTCTFVLECCAPSIKIISFAFYCSNERHLLNRLTIYLTSPQMNHLGKLPFIRESE